MTHSDLTELQIEISELERENQDLRDRVKELEVNLTYLSNQIESGKPNNTKMVAEKNPTNDSVVH